MKDARLTELMLEIKPLDVSIVYLFKEQTYHGRCVVAYKDHHKELSELTEAERNAFMNDVARVGAALTKTFRPAKVNYGAYSDKMKHLHFHVVPKYIDGPSYGSTFEMNPQKVYLSPEEYDKLSEAIKANL
jgi:diadenosine tetraphosphate (Ap4A) HIT family hydrolase